MSNVTYINTDTASLIKESQILQETDDGIVVKLESSWKLIPGKAVEEETTNNDYFIDEAPAFKKQDKDPDPYLANSQNADTPYTEKLERRFGFTDLTFSTKTTAPVSGICSNPIDVKDVSYFTVDADVTGLETGSVELSVIDNMDEIPILWNNNWTVYKEKLFPEQPTRFLIDPEQSVILYEDNLVSKKEYTTLSAQDFQNHTYAITYTAIKDPCRYYPVSDTVRLKILIRQYYDAAPYVSVGHLVMKQHGVTPQWNSKV